MKPPKEVWALWKLPKGIILLWSGLVSAIPKGWHLCDGSENTPDLRDLFAIAAGGSYNPHDTGGAAEHTHQFATVGHGHLHVGIEALNIAPGTGLSHTIVHMYGQTDPAENLPPYYSLAYIMKL